MKQSALINIITTLNDNHVRYMIAGGLAVVFHGYVRFTSDVDLVIDLQVENIEKAIKVFEDLGYKPMVPINFSDFKYKEAREKWINDKGMIVLSLYNPDNMETPVDIFIQIPFNFEEEYKKSVKHEIVPGLVTYFISYEQLINMKMISGRDIDLADIKYLEQGRK